MEKIATVFYGIASDLSKLEARLRSVREDIRGGRIVPWDIRVSLMIKMQSPLDGLRYLEKEGYVTLM